MAMSSIGAMSTGVQSVDGYGVNLPSYSDAGSSFNPQSIAIGMQAMGGVAGAIGAYDSTSARKNMLSLDANIADMQATQALNAGQAQEENSRLQTGALFGKQRAQLAANGVQLGSGSALDVLSGTKLIGDIDATTIHNNALRAAWGYQTQASIDRFASNQVSPSTSAFSTLLGSAGSVANSWYRYNQGMNGATVPTA